MEKRRGVTQRCGLSDCYVNAILHSEVGKNSQLNAWWMQYFKQQLYLIKEEMALTSRLYWPPQELCWGPCSLPLTRLGLALSQDKLSCNGNKMEILIRFIPALQFEIRLNSVPCIEWSRALALPRAGGHGDVLWINFHHNHKLNVPWQD